MLSWQSEKWVKKIVWKKFHKHTKPWTRVQEIQKLYFQHVIFRNLANATWDKAKLFTLCINLRIKAPLKLWWYNKIFIVVSRSVCGMSKFPVRRSTREFNLLLLSSYVSCLCVSSAICCLCLSLLRELKIRLLLCWQTETFLYFFMLFPVALEYKISSKNSIKMIESNNCSI